MRIWFAAISLFVILFASPSLLAFRCDALTAYVESVLTNPSFRGPWPIRKLKLSEAGRIARDYSPEILRIADFDAWANTVNPIFENGLPTYESRPVPESGSDWIEAFAREHPNDTQLIAEIDRQMSLTKAKIDEHLSRRDLIQSASESDELEDTIADLTTRRQYYREMREWMTGMRLPFPGQDVNVFLQSRYVDSRALKEARIRVHNHEKRANDLNRQIHRASVDRGTIPFDLVQKEAHELERAKFYRELIAKMPASVHEAAAEAAAVARRHYENLAPLRRANGGG